jgi:hypothetical protein
MKKILFMSMLVALFGYCLTSSAEPAPADQNESIDVVYTSGLADTYLYCFGSETAPALQGVADKGKATKVAFNDHKAVVIEKKKNIKKLRGTAEKSDTTRTGWIICELDDSNNNMLAKGKVEIFRTTHTVNAIYSAEKAMLDLVRK